MPPFGRTGEPPHGPGIRDPEVEAAVGRERGRIPGAAAAGRGEAATDRGSSRSASGPCPCAGRAHTARRGRSGAKPTVEVKTRPRAASGAMSTNCSWPFVEPPRPELAAGPRVERERRACRSRRRSVRPGEREAVRPVVRRLDEVVPAQPPVASVERVHRRAEVLHVDGRSRRRVGVEANDPNVEPRVSGNRQRDMEAATVRDVIGRR